MFLKISQNAQENTCAKVYFLIRLQASSQALVFSCEFYKIFKNAFSQNTSGRLLLNKNNDITFRGYVTKLCSNTNKKLFVVTRVTKFMSWSLFLIKTPFFIEHPWWLLLYLYSQCDYCPLVWVIHNVSPDNDIY